MSFPLPPASSLLTPLPAPAPPAPKRPRWWVVVIGLVVFLLPVVLVAQVVLIKKMSHRPAAGANSEERPASPVNEPRTKSPPTDDPGAPPPEPAVDPLMEALGDLTSAQLLQSYLNIGFLADGADKGLYEGDEASEWLEKVVLALETVAEHLRRVPPARLDPAGRKQLSRARELNTLLRVQARELQLYWETGEKDHIERFQKVRKEAWDGIQSHLKGGK